MVKLKADFTGAILVSSKNRSKFQCTFTINQVCLIDNILFAEILDISLSDMFFLVDLTGFRCKPISICCYIAQYIS